MAFSLNWKKQWYNISSTEVIDALIAFFFFYKKYANIIILKLEVRDIEIFTPHTVLRWLHATGPICFEFFLFSRQMRKYGFPVKPYYVEEISAVTTCTYKYSVRLWVWLYEVVFILFKMFFYDIWNITAYYNYTGSQ